MPNSFRKRIKKCAFLRYISGEEAREIIQALNKDVPAKTFQWEHEEEHYYICPKCTLVEKQTIIEHNRYCRLCGQRLELE